MESTEKSDKRDFISNIKNELLEGHFEKALLLQNNSELQLNEINSIANTVFLEILAQKKYGRAIELAERYNLSQTMVNDAAAKGFIYLLVHHKYEEAVKWGLDYKLSSNELVKAKTKLFESLIEKKNIKGALNAVGKYNIPHDAIKNSASAAFNNAYQNKDYSTAAFLGKEFDMPRKRVLLAAVKAFEEHILKEKWNDLIELENEFNIISDSAFNEISEKDRISAINTFFENAVKKNIKIGKLKIAISILESTGIMSRKYSKVPLKELINKILIEIAHVHKILLTKGNFEDAFDIINRFELLESNAPVEVKASVIEAAQSFNEILLKKNQFEEARNLKKKYGLFDKNVLPGSFEAGLSSACNFLESSLISSDFNKSFEVIKEYNIPKDRSTVIATNVVIVKLNKSQFEDVFSIINKFKVNFSDEKLQEEAQNKFLDALKNNHFEIAAELGRIFNIDAKKTKECAYKAWQRYIKSGKFDKALYFKKVYKIPPSWTENTAREVYKYNLTISRPDIAKKIRSEYYIKSNIFTIILEYIKSIFSRK